MRKVMLILFVCLFVVGGLYTTPHAADKVGFINLQRLVNESDMGKKARAELVKLRKEKEAVAAEKAGKINELRGLISDKGASMSGDEKQEKIEELQKIYKEYQRLVADAKEDITREDSKLVAIIMKKADGILKKVAKKKGYTIIIKDPNAIGFLDPSVDITDLVLKELNKKK